MAQWEINHIAWSPHSSYLLRGYQTLQLFPCLKTPTLIAEPQNVVFLRDSCCTDLGCDTACCWHQPPSSLDDELCVCLQKFNTIWFLCICHTYWGCLAAPSTGSAHSLSSMGDRSGLTLVFVQAPAEQSMFPKALCTSKGNGRRALGCGMLTLPTPASPIQVFAPWLCPPSQDVMLDNSHGIHVELCHS